MINPLKITPKLSKFYFKCNLILCIKSILKCSEILILNLEKYVLEIDSHEFQVRGVIVAMFVCMNASAA